MAMFLNRVIRPIWQVVLAACLLSLGACTTTTTVAKLKDNSRASLAFLRLGRSTLKPIQQGSADMEVNIGRLGVLQSGYIRRENMALRVDCGQCLDGSKTLLSEDGFTASSSGSVDDILEERKGRRGKLRMHYLYAVSEEENINPVLEIPPSNVDYFDETSEPVRELAWMLVPGVALTGVGIWMMAQGDAGPGVAFLLPGLALGVFGGMQLFMSPKQRRYGPDGQRREMPKLRPAEPEEEKEAEEKEDDWGPPAEEKAEEEQVVEKEEEEPEPEAKPEPEPEPEPEEEEEEEEKPPPPKKKKPKKKRGGESLDDFLL